MDKTIEQIREYVLLMLGAPAVTVDLGDEELNFCVNTPISMVQKRGLTGIVNHNVLKQLVQEGAYALGKYIVAKKKFKKALNTYLFTPDDDGFAEMTQADSDWAEFIGKIKNLSYVLKKYKDI